jgi:hypothetical protein
MKVKRGNSVVLLLSLSAIIAFSEAAHGTVIVPGPGAFPPDIFPGCAGCTLLASINSGPVTTATLTLDLTSAVYADPANFFGSGDLDFVYQVSNSASSTDSVGRVTARSFTGFSTDVGFTAVGSTLPGGLFVNGTVAPALVDRLSSGTVGFSFNFFPPGETSTVLMIQTNATHFAPGKTNIIDGSVATVDSFEPTGRTVTPEPSSVVLFGTGLLTAAGALRRRLLS